jgi:hypothetical protein
VRSYARLKGLLRALVGRDGTLSIRRDVLSKARGLKTALPQDAGGGSITVRPASEHVKASLRTRDSREAKERHAAAFARLSAVWDG